MKTVSILLALMSLPIGMYIQYSVLQSIHADRLLMFLFWANWPLIILVTIIDRALRKED